MSDYLKQWHDIAQQIRDLNMQDSGWNASKWRQLKHKLQHIEGKLRSEGVELPERDFQLL